MSDAERSDDLCEHGFYMRSQCPKCAPEGDKKAELEFHETVFVNLAAIALWVGQDPVEKQDTIWLDNRARDCWEKARVLWRNRLGV